MALPSNDEDCYDDPIILFDQAELRSFEKEHYNFTNTCVEPSDVKFSSKSFVKDTTLNGSSSELPLPFFYIPDNLKLLNECRPLIIKIVDCEKHPWYHKKKYPKMDDTRNKVVPVKSKSVSKNDVNSDVVPKVSTFQSKFKCISDYPDETGKMTSSKIKGTIDLTAAGVSAGSKNKIEIDFQKNKGLEGMKVKLVFEFHEDSFNESKKIIKLENNNLKKPKKNIKSKNLKSSTKNEVGVSTSINKNSIKPNENVTGKMQNKIICTKLSTNTMYSPKIILGKNATPRKEVPCFKHDMVPVANTTSDITNVTKQCVNNSNNKDNYTIQKNSLNDTTYIFKKIAGDSKIHDNIQSANVTSTESLSSNNATKSSWWKSKSSPEEVGKIKKPIKRAPKKSKCGNTQAAKQENLGQPAGICLSQPKKNNRENNRKMIQDPKPVDRTKIVNSTILPDITITASKNDILSSYGPSNLTNTNHFYQCNNQLAKYATNAKPINENPTVVVNNTRASIAPNIVGPSTEGKHNERLLSHVETVIEHNSLPYNSAKTPVKYNYEKLNSAPQITQCGKHIQRNNITPIPISTMQNNNNMRSGRPIPTQKTGTLNQRFINIRSSVPVPRPYLLELPNANSNPIIDEAPQQQQAHVNHKLEHNYQTPINTLLRMPPPPYFNRFDNFGIKPPPTLPMHIPQNHKGNMMTNTVAGNNAYSFSQQPNCPLYSEYIPFYMTTVPPPGPPPPVRIIEQNVPPPGPPPPVRIFEQNVAPPGPPPPVKIIEKYVPHPGPPSPVRIIEQNEPSPGPPPPVRIIEQNVPPPGPPPPVRIIEQNLQQQSNAVSSTKNVVGSNVTSYGVVKKINLQTQQVSTTNGSIPCMEEQNGKQIYPPKSTNSVMQINVSLYNKKDQNIQKTQHNYASPQLKSVPEGNILPSFTKDYEYQNTHHSYKPAPTKSFAEENLLLFSDNYNEKEITQYKHISKPIGSFTLDNHHYPKKFNESEGEYVYNGLDHNKIAEKIIMEVRHKTNGSSRESQQVANLKNTQLSQTGYSPPILPIPTFENGLELLAQASLENSMSHAKEDSNRTGDISCEKKKRKLKEYDDNGNPKKKISIEEYKNRGKSNSQNIIDLTTDDMKAISQ